METVTVKPVLTSREISQFIRFPKDLYSGCEQFVPDFDSDIRRMFDPRRNSALAFSELQGFLACKGDKVVGRIVAMINRHANEKWNSKIVRFGYFDFVDDMAVSSALLDTVVAWGKERGMTKIQGPLGLTDYDKEGMLVEDFDRKSTIVTYYNYDYYPRHMEALGYDKAADWLSVRVVVPEEVPQKYARVSKLSAEMFGLRTRHVSKSDIRGEYGRKMFQLLNEAYAPLFGFAPMTEKQSREFINSYLPAVDMRMVPMVENDKGELVSLAVTLPALDDAVRRGGGRMLPFGWWHLLKALKWKLPDTADMLLIAVRPDYQGLGVNALIFNDLIPIYNRLGIRYAETGPQLENNVKELSQWKPLNPELIKRRRCYQKEIK